MNLRMDQIRAFVSRLTEQPTSGPCKRLLQRQGFAWRWQMLHSSACLWILPPSRFSAVPQLRRTPNGPNVWSAQLPSSRSFHLKDPLKISESRCVRVSSSMANCCPSRRPGSFPRTVGKRRHKKIWWILNLWTWDHQRPRNNPVVFWHDSVVQSDSFEGRESTNIVWSYWSQFVSILLLRINANVVQYTLGWENNPRLCCVSVFPNAISCLILCVCILLFIAMCGYYYYKLDT